MKKESVFVNLKLTSHISVFLRCYLFNYFDYYAYLFYIVQVKDYWNNIDDHIVVLLRILDIICREMFSTSFDFLVS